MNENNNLGTSVKLWVNENNNFGSSVKLWMNENIYLGTFKPQFLHLVFGIGKGLWLSADVTFCPAIAIPVRWWQPFT